MQEFKKIVDVLEPDSTMRMFSYPDAKTGVLKQWDLEETHRRVSQLQVDHYVPEEIRSYFNSLKNVLLYSYFHYGFVPISAFLATTAVEMALRTLYPWKPGPGKNALDKRSFHSLFKRAIDEGKVREEDFLWLPEVREQKKRMWDEYEQATGFRVARSSERYERALLRSMVRMRNYFAHPSSGHTLITFEMAYGMIRPCADIINQLFRTEGGADRSGRQVTIAPANRRL